MNLGEKIREARKRAGFSKQKDFARHLQIEQNTLSRYEAGAHPPKPELLRRIAKACGVTIGYLYGETGRGLGVSESVSPYRTIPIVGAASALEGGELIIEWNQEEFAGEVLIKASERYIEVKGDSLAPVAVDGQKVMFDNERPPKNGDLCVAIIRKGPHRGMTLIKRYWEEKDLVLLGPVSHTGRPIAVKKIDGEFYLVTGVRFV